MHTHVHPLHTHAHTTPHLFLGLCLDSVPLNLHHELLCLLLCLHQLWLQLLQFLLHDRHLRGSKFQLLQAHCVPLLHQQNLITLLRQQRLECEDQLQVRSWCDIILAAEDGIVLL